ncbi:hypothetical protein LY78DRAFT_79389 [Colletotrichum sublineola]|nr:hypothetical protein LY78DRAFT_79389 [Colletotrichum sublineola]
MGSLVPSTSGSRDGLRVCCWTGEAVSEMSAPKEYVNATLMCETWSRVPKALITAEQCPDERIVSGRIVRCIIIYYHALYAGGLSLDRFVPLLLLRVTRAVVAAMFPWGPFACSSRSLGPSSLRHLMISLMMRPTMPMVMRTTQMVMQSRQMASQNSSIPLQSMYMATR